MVTLVIEDGTGVAGANTYIDVTFADTYFTDRHITAWPSGNNQKDHHLVQAFDYLEALTYNGLRLFPDTQTASFPRQYIYIDNVHQDPIPLKLKYAQCELALLASTGSLYPTIDPTTNTTVGLIKRYKKETLGVQGSGVKSEIEYMDGAVGYLGVKVFPQVKALLSGLVTSANQLRVYR